MQRDLGPGVREVRIGLGGDQQEGLRAESSRAHSGDLDEQLVAAEAQCPDDPRRERLAEKVACWE
jgi:hypothetical protein